MILFTYVLELVVKVNTVVVRKFIVFTDTLIGFIIEAIVACYAYIVLQCIVSRCQPTSVTTVVSNIRLTTMEVRIIITVCRIIWYFPTGGLKSNVIAKVEVLHFYIPCTTFRDFIITIAKASRPSCTIEMLAAFTHSPPTQTLSKFKSELKPYIFLAYPFTRLLTRV